jgi:quinol monooxygenase YgiN
MRRRSSWSEAGAAPLTPANRSTGQTGRIVATARRSAMGELVGIARFRFHEGKVEEYKRLSQEAMEIVRAKEPGTLEYSIYFNADETAAVVIERFRDSDAALEQALEHSRNMAEIGAKVMETGTLVGELLGDVSPEIRANIESGDQPKLYRPWLSK